MNTNVMTILMYSFLDTNIIGIQECLADDGTFLNRSKTAFLAWLNTQFSSYRNTGIHSVVVHNEICMDALPGLEVFDFKFALDKALLGENDMYISEPNTPARTGEARLCFTFQLNRGKVVTILPSRNYLSKSLVPSNETELNYN